jgi:hypothetical protein
VAGGAPGTSAAMGATIVSKAPDNQLAPLRFSFGVSVLISCKRQCVDPSWHLKTQNFTNAGLPTSCALLGPRCLQVTLWCAWSHATFNRLSNVSTPLSSCVVLHSCPCLHVDSLELCFFFTQPHVFKGLETLLSQRLSPSASKFHRSWQHFKW